MPREPTIAGLAVWVGAASKTNGGMASCGWMGASATTGAVLACVHSKTYSRVALACMHLYTYSRAVFVSIHNIHLLKGCVCEHTQ